MKPVVSPSPIAPPPAIQNRWWPVATLLSGLALAMGAHPAAATEEAQQACSALVAQLNRCASNSPYNAEAIAGCEKELSTYSVTCQQLALALSNCEAKLTCPAYLAPNSSACARQTAAFVDRCGERARSPMDEAKAGIAPHGPSFLSLGYHLRALRRVAAEGQTSPSK